MYQLPDDGFNSAPDPHNQLDELFRSFIFHVFSEWRLKVYANGFAVFFENRLNVAFVSLQ